MKRFPEFMCTEANLISDEAQGGAGMEGYLFEGADDVQVVFWQNEEGGESPEAVHDFWEYALVVEGTFDGKAGDREVHLGPGDEAVIPPGVPHSGKYSAGYRAIDVFSSRRVSRPQEKKHRD
ncbi:MAG: AraC family ligand binding domain-containing protein [Planctomycetes bacterium]|nr:AraC family ligand binding domain-containing protein [Planctomycetota bacterium]